MLINLYNKVKDFLVPSLSLFTSFGTLICCALPALFITLGMGATLAGLVSSAPWLITASQHKEILFTIAGVLIALSVFMQWNVRNRPCPIDKAQAIACTRLRKISTVILIVSIVIYSIGFFFAFLAADIFF